MINQSNYRKYILSYGNNRINVTEQIARKASQVKNCYWKLKEYGLVSRPLKVAEQNFQIIHDWINVSTLFENLSDYDKRKSSGDYLDFKKYNAALLDFLNNQAKAMREAA